MKRKPTAEDCYKLIQKMRTDTKPYPDFPSMRCKLSSKRYVHVARWAEKHCWLIKFANSRGKVHRTRLSDEAMAALMDGVNRLMERD